MSLVHACAVIFRSGSTPDRPISVLAARIEIPPHPKALDPWVSRLQLDGKRGTVLLMDLASRRIVARREVHPGVTWGSRRKTVTDPAPK